MAIVLPRMARISGPSSGRSVNTRSRPFSCNVTVPDTIRPGREISRMMANAVTLFPHPLSPTTPIVSPRGTSRVTPSTARTTPSSKKNWA